jgi:elongation factor G
MNQSIGANTRNVALVGPYSSGKTSLLESLLFVTGAITRKGKISDRNTVADSSTQARDRQMSVEVSVAHSQYQDLNFTFLDCGAAIIVCEPVVDRVLTLAPLLKFLDDWEIPHLIFINKMDRCNSHFNEVLQALKSVSSRPLVPQQYPIRQNNEIIGFIDLINEQAYHYHANSPADPVALPDHLKEEEQIARQEMLETIAEFDDHLLEELLEDINPSREEILQDLKQELGADQIVPVFFGMAERDYGVRHLLTALVEEAPAPTITANRRGLDPSADGDAVVQILKTYFTPQGGRLSLARIWQGTLNDGMALNGVRIGGIYRLMGQQQQPLQQAQAGEIVALGRLEGIATGDVVSSGSQKPDLPKGLQLKPVFALAIAAANRKDEVKLSSALTKLIEEDPSLYWEQHGDTKEVILWGQGEIHLQVALDRLARKYNLPMTTHLPQVPYKETIKTSTKSHGRYKHQTGGHGAFGDVYLDIKPLARGEGFHFHETIVGGVVPKQYIPGVETGVREYLGHGPLGFPVVDIDVTLTDGSYHSVDSSEQAFKQAARLAMTEGLPKCHPVLLEPILSVTVLAPSEYTAKVLQLISGKRGQIQGFEASEEWKGWDQVTAYLPQAEMHDLIVELRSLTMGVGFFQWDEDHLQEVPDKLRDAVLAMQGNGNNK